MAAAPPPPPPTELLTQLQDQLHTVSKMFFDFVGILQRDAPPLSVGGEPLVAPPQTTSTSQPQQPQQQQQQQQGQPPPFDVEQTTQLMASQLIEQFKLTEALIRSLPDDTSTAATQTERIAALQKEHADVSADLDAAAREAEAQLGELQRLFAVLARQRLRDAAAGVVLPPLAALGGGGGGGS
jgi:hypothetical protein